MNWSGPDLFMRIWRIVCAPAEESHWQALRRRDGRDRSGQIWDPNVFDSANLDTRLCGGGSRREFTAHCKFKWKAEVREPRNTT